MRRTSSALSVLIAVLGLPLAGCGGDDRAGTPPGVTGTAPGPGAATSAAVASGAAASGAATSGAASPARPSAGRAARTRPGTTTSDRARRAARPAIGAAADPPPRSWDAACPTPTPSPMGCRAVRGRVLSIQSYDPDGDGDLHVIAVGGDVTFPGITVFDVRASLRPARDPVRGEYVTGAGPVFRGSLKQHQIQVDTFRVWRPRR